jgi:hypothetical protein
MQKEFNVGDRVAIGENGKKGKIVNKYKPLGTYILYTVHLFHGGTFVSAAKHELVKGMDESDFLPSNIISTTSTTLLQPTISIPSATSTAHRNESPEVPTEIPPSPTCTLFSEEIPTEIFDLFEEIVQNEASNEIQNADPSKSSRFQAVYDADVDKFNQDHENDNTKRKTLGHIKLLTQYLVQNGENRQIGFNP